jgi:hypothetical protein
MSPIRITRCMIAERLAERPPGYWSDLSPAIVERFADGSVIFDQDHPAWRIALHKYSNIQAIPPDFDPKFEGPCCDPPRPE